MTSKRAGQALCAILIGLSAVAVLVAGPLTARPAQALITFALAAR